MAKIEDVAAALIQFKEGVSADTPLAGIVRIYAKSDGKLYKKDDAGIESEIGGGGTEVENICRVTIASNLSVPSAQNTIVNFNVESFDTNAIHDNSTNPSRLTCKVAGKYLVLFSCGWGVSSAGLRWVSIRKNGTINLVDDNKPGNASYSVNNHIYTVTELAVGNYLEAEVHQSSGGSLLLNNINISFCMVKVG